MLLQIEDINNILSTLEPIYTKLKKEKQEKKMQKN